MTPFDEAVPDAAHGDEVIVSVPGVFAVPAEAAEGPDAGSWAGPSSIASVRRGYVDQAVVGYIVYGVGATIAFLALQLSLSDAQAAFHSSALALGIVLAGLLSHRLDRLVGMRVVHFFGLGLFGVAALLIAWAPAFGVTLLAAAAVGLGSGLILAHVNQIMSSGGGPLARVRIARSTVVSMAVSVTVPIFIGIGVATGIGWQLAFMPALLLVGVAVLATRGFENRPTPSVRDDGSLPRAFWLVWLMIILVVAVEFASVVWASSLVGRRTGVSLADATLVISALVAGMIVGRGGLSAHAISGRDPVWLLRGGVTLAMLGVLVPWAAASYELSMAGMFIAGIGIGMLYPLSASIAMAMVPGHARVASGQLVLASGLAILVSPLILGFVAEATSVTEAWLLIPLFCIAALVLSVPVAGARRAQAEAG